MARRPARRLPALRHVSTPLTPRPLPLFLGTPPMTAASLPAYRYIGQRVVELGSGPGLVGILLAKLGARVAVTDIGKVRRDGTRRVAGLSA